MKKILYILAVLACSGAVAQNQFHQSQYMNHHAFFNPGAVASYHSLNAAGFFKNQWTGFSGAPSIQGISIAKPLGSYKAGWGAQIIHDKIGVNNSFQIAGTYAYKVQLQSNMNIGLGLSGVLNASQSNFTEVQTIVSDDPMFMENSPMVMMPNFRFGAYAYNEDYYFGLAIPNLLKNQIVANAGETSFDMANMHWYINAGKKVIVTDDLELWPSVMFKHVSGTPLQFDINANATFQEKVGVGLSYRSSQEFIMMANYWVNDQFLIGYSYDLGLGDLSLFHSGSHEIMLIYKVRTSYKDTPQTQQRTTI